MMPSAHPVHHPVRALPPPISRNGFDTSRLRLALEVNSMEAMKRAILNGTGVAFIAETAVHEDLAAGRMVEVPFPGIDFTRSLRVMVNKSRYRTLAVREFLKDAFDVETLQQDGLLDPPDDSESDWLQSCLQSFTLKRRFLDGEEIDAMTEDLEAQPPRLNFDDRRQQQRNSTSTRKQLNLLRSANVDGRLLDTVRCVALLCIGWVFIFICIICMINDHMYDHTTHMYDHTTASVCACPFFVLFVKKRFCSSQTGNKNLFDVMFFSWPARRIPAPRCRSTCPRSLSS